MTASQAKRIIDMIATTPQASATLIARTLNVSRPYVYDVARSAGYVRQNKQWETVNDTQIQNDLQYQMLSEIHEAVVGGRNTAGRVHVELPKAWDVQDGYVLVPVDASKPLGSAAKAYAEAVPRIDQSNKPDGLKDMASNLLGAIMHRINELEN